MTAVVPEPFSSLTITWNPLPDTYPLPDDPVEDESHPKLAAALSDALTHNVPTFAQDTLIVSNFALCATVNQRTICKAPDWMLVHPLSPRADGLPRRSYTPHAEGPVPLVVMEFLSTRHQGEYSMRRTGQLGKWFFYEQVIRVPIYVIFRPLQGTLEVHRLDEFGHYKPVEADAHNRYPIPVLDLRLGIWSGTYGDRAGHWLRWWDSSGVLLPWSEERASAAQQQLSQTEQQLSQTEQQLSQAEQQLLQAEQRAQRLAEQLRQLGVDPDLV